MLSKVITLHNQSGQVRYLSILDTGDTDDTISLRRVLRKLYFYDILCDFLSYVEGTKEMTKLKYVKVFYCHICVQ